MLIVTASAQTGLVTIAVMAYIQTDGTLPAQPDQTPLDSPIQK